jgi:hypothetical protein
MNNNAHVATIPLATAILSAGAFTPGSSDRSERPT